MNIHILPTPDEMGRESAAAIAAKLNCLIERQGNARLLLSTGASQFPMFQYLVGEAVNWTKVEMFHLDEYIGLPESHIASFRRYLRERFISKVNLKAAYLVDGEGDIDAVKQKLSEILAQAPIDIGVVGIGENGHIAFNDPPADFDIEEPYITVTLDEKCKAQQVREGWFENLDAVPRQALSMSVKQIMKCKEIISIVPHAVKAQALYNTFTFPLTNRVPATMLKLHPQWTLYMDQAAASGLMRF